MTSKTLAAIKTALRLSEDVYDGQIERLYDAAVEDMDASGIPAWVTAGEDARTVEAAILYCKAHFNNSPEEAAKWQPLYDLYVAKFAVDVAAKAEAVCDA